MKMSVCKALFITVKPSDGQPSVSDYKRGAVSAGVLLVLLSLRDPHVSSLNRSDCATFVLITSPD